MKASAARFSTLFQSNCIVQAYLAIMLTLVFLCCLLVLDAQANTHTLISLSALANNKIHPLPLPLDHDPWD